MKFRIGNSSTRSRNGKQAGGGGGGGCLIAFGLIFAGAGIAAFIALTSQALEEAATYLWTETPCTVRSCEIEDNVSDENPFILAVDYAYEFGGQSYTSSRYTLQETRHDTYEKLALKRKALLSDGVVCYVDPDEPSRAVIRREGIKSGLTSLFPLIFVAVGSLIVWAGIATVRKKKKTDSGGGSRVDSISAEAKGKSVAGWKVGAIFGSVFFLAGAGMIYPLAIGPVTKMKGSENWMETSCKVIWSTVRRHESKDSDGHTSITYNVDIFYEYEFNGEAHRSNTYGFLSSSSSGRSAKQKVVNQYRKGSEQLCYVNPNLPEQAVLKPGFGWSALLGLIPVVIGGIGALMLIASIRSGRKKRAESADQSHERFRQQITASGGPDTSRAEAAGISATGSGPKTLTPSGSRAAKTFGCLAIALFWNGIVSVFVYHVVQGFRSGDPEWFATIFMIPFVLVGLAMFIGFLYQLLAMANPRPVLTLNPGTVRLGQPFDLQWELRGNASRLSSLKLSLWGVESATFRRGTNTHTSNEVFYADEIASITQLLTMQSGAEMITIPSDLMYSFGSGNNVIKYELRIDGDVPFWPDIGDRYEIDVLPQTSES